MASDLMKKPSGFRFDEEAEWLRFDEKRNGFRFDEEAEWLQI